MSWNKNKLKMYIENRDLTCWRPFCPPYCFEIPLVRVSYIFMPYLVDNRQTFTRFQSFSCVCNIRPPSWAPSWISQIAQGWPVVIKRILVIGGLVYQKPSKHFLYTAMQGWTSRRPDYMVKTINSWRKQIRYCMIKV